MSAISTPFPERSGAWTLPYRGTVAMACLIIAEASIFTIFVVAYLYYAGKSLSGPTPREAPSAYCRAALRFISPHDFSILAGAARFSLFGSLRSSSVASFCLALAASGTA